jgi:endonuclease/exonuclease/phosphatase family metal-dependent hydrolase
VATLNILYKNRDVPAVVRMLQACDADVICLQEVNARALGDIAWAMIKTHTYIRRRPEKHRAGGYAVLSRLPILSEEYIPPRHGPFGAQSVDVLYDRRRVRIINVHLQVTVPGPGTLPWELLANLRRDERVRAAEIRHIWKLLAHDGPMVVTGDFNSPFYLKAPRFCVDRGMVDAVAATHAEPETQSTVSTKVNGTLIRPRIDYVFVSEHFQPAASRTVATKGSDHSLVRAEMAWNPRGPGPGPVCTQPAEPASIVLRMDTAASRMFGNGKPVACVYIVCADADAKPTFARQRDETIDAIARIAPGGSFAVLVLSDGKVTALTNGLCKAHQDAKVQAVRALEKIKPTGRADVRAGVQRALALLEAHGRPSQIHLVGHDGLAADKKSVEDLAKVIEGTNGEAKAKLFVYVFAEAGSARPRDLHRLEELARDSGGFFKRILPKEPAKRSAP